MFKNKYHLQAEIFPCYPSSRRPRLTCQVACSTDCHISSGKEVVLPPQEAGRCVSLNDALVMCAMVSAHCFAHSDVSKPRCFCIVLQSPRIVKLATGMSMSDVVIGDLKKQTNPTFFFHLQMQNRGACRNFKVSISATAVSICNPFLTEKLEYAFSFKLFFDHLYIIKFYLRWKPRQLFL